MSGFAFNRGIQSRGHRSVRLHVLAVFPVKSSESFLEQLCSSFVCVTRAHLLEEAPNPMPRDPFKQLRVAQVKEAAQFTDDVMQAMAEKLGINVMAPRLQTASRDLCTYTCVCIYIYMCERERESACVQVCIYIYIYIRATAFIYVNTMLS